jgi:ribosome-associated protein
LKTSNDVTSVAKTKLNTNSKLMKTILAAILDKKGEEVVSLNLKKIPEAIADFFIICEANNPTYGESNRG